MNIDTLNSGTRGISKRTARRRGFQRECACNRMVVIIVVIPHVGFVVECTSTFVSCEMRLICGGHASDDRYVVFVR